MERTFIVSDKRSLHAVTAAKVNDIAAAKDMPIEAGASPAFVSCPKGLVNQCWRRTRRPLSEGAPWIMRMRLHANAATTPKTRAYIQQSTAPVAVLAKEPGVSQTAIRRWKGRSSAADGSHTPKRLRISLTATEEEIVRELRQRLELPLDDIVETMKRCVNPKLSRSAIHRCLVRHGISRSKRPAPKEPGRFDKHPFGFVHADLKHLPGLRGAKSYVFVAIERAARFVYVEIVMRRGASTIARCLERFLKAFGHPVHTILTDNGSEFTDRFAVDMKDKPKGKPSGRHPFDRICAANFSGALPHDALL